MDILYIIAGVAFLYVGGEWILTGALATAEKLKIPKIFSAVVLVGFGTSAPELFVGINAMVTGEADLAVGNVLGSNVANVLLISGLGMVLAPMVHKVKFIGLECVMLLISSAFLLVLMYTDGGIYNGVSWLMLALLGVYFVMATRRSGNDNVEEGDASLSTWRTIGYIVGGLALLSLGAESLIFGAVNMAMAFAISEAIIGLSVVAIGTSLPELATTIVAVRRNQGEMVIGNVLGSNIFNILLILGVSASINEVDLSYEVFGQDMWLGMISSIVLVTLLMFRKTTRSFGILFLLAYTLYVISWTIR